MAPLGRPPKIDRQLLHEFLWKTRGRGDYMTQTQLELSKEFGVTTATMRLIFQEMAEGNRLRRVGAKFLIRDTGVRRRAHDQEPAPL